MLLLAAFPTLLSTAQKGPEPEPIPFELAHAAKSGGLKFFKSDRSVLKTGEVLYFFAARSPNSGGPYVIISIRYNSADHKQPKLGDQFRGVMRWMQLPPRGEVEISKWIARTSLFTSGFGLANDLYIFDEHARWSLLGLNGEASLSNVVSGKPSSSSFLEAFARESVPLRLESAVSATPGI